MTTRRKRRSTHNRQWSPLRCSYLFSAFELAYNPYRPNDRLKLTASALTDFSQYASTPGRRAHYTTQDSPFFPSGGRIHRQYILIAPIHGGMARLSGPEWPG